MKSNIIIDPTKDRPFIVALSMVKNEEDIIEPFIRHNMKYVDLFCILDNNSFDHTREIIESLQSEGLPIILIDDPEKAYNQKEKITKLCHHAMLTLFPDYLLFLDADEFIKCKSKTDFLHEINQIPKDGKAFIPWQSYITNKSGSESNGFNMLKRLNNEESPQFKAILRIDGNYNSNIIITQGNHDIIGIDNSSYSDEIKIAHYPIRNLKQLKEKCIAGWMAYLLKSPNARHEELGWHWLEMFDKIKSDTLDEELAIEISANYSKTIDENWENRIINDPIKFNFLELKYTKKSSLSSLSKIAKLIEDNLEEKRDPFYQYFNEVLEKKENKQSDETSKYSENDQIFSNDWHFENLFIDIPPFKYFYLKYKPETILDVGCGIGQYLTYFKYAGATRITGIDGISGEASLLEKSEFISQDLENGFEQDQKFDVVICLETLEHLNHETSLRVLKDISKCANKQILFSAAEPGQPGLGHINCMPIDFWIEKWESLGWEVNEFDSISMRMLSTFSWFKRNILVLNKVHTRVITKHPLIDHISQKEFIWWNQKPAIVLSTLQEDLYVPQNQIIVDKTSVAPSLTDINQLLKVELKKTIEDIEKQEIVLEKLKLNNTNQQNQINRQSNVIDEQYHSIEKHSQEISSLHQSIYLLNLYIAKIKKSFSWRITSPLRFLNIVEWINKYSQRKWLKEINNSSLFNRDYYLQNNSDLQKMKMNPAKHYLLHGGSEGRQASQQFDSLFYLETYPDVKDSGINPLVHYLKYGKKEGRQTIKTQSI
ncbi:MAG: methyltransferase domain-containing protein [Bacteroidales bacterium]|nr:methyltransferase domain-containing protein [Bacteroidales bacterium]